MSQRILYYSQSTKLCVVLNIDLFPRTTSENWHRGSNNNNNDKNTVDRVVLHVKKLAGQSSSHLASLYPSVLAASFSIFDNSHQSLSSELGLRSLSQIFFV
mmetsp:Transcript_11630/g.27859  ORF Transcript_11630/g.27859 Transcript_11630/m.27859 type:complete len:101 (+) Transcript_11630:261-563(+)